MIGSGELLKHPDCSTGIPPLQLLSFPGRDHFRRTVPVDLKYPAESLPARDIIVEKR
jgi:hypothetical protein